MEIETKQHECPGCHDGIAKEFAMMDSRNRCRACGAKMYGFRGAYSAAYSTHKAMDQAARDKFSKLVSEGGATEFERFKKKYKLKRLEV